MYVLAVCRLQQITEQVYNYSLISPDTTMSPIHLWRIIQFGRHPRDAWSLFPRKLVITSRDLPPKSRESEPAKVRRLPVENHREGNAELIPRFKERHWVVNTQNFFDEMSTRYKHMHFISATFIVYVVDIVCSIALHCLLTDIYLSRKITRFWRQMELFLKGYICYACLISSWILETFFKEFLQCTYLGIMLDRQNT